MFCRVFFEQMLMLLQVTGSWLASCLLVLGGWAMPSQWLYRHTEGHPSGSHNK
jgi:hypothetical protein